jgi:nucleoside-diphosphate kinase
VITAFLIKPNAFVKGHSGEILAMVEAAGFKVIALRLFSMTRPFAEAFYEMHRGKEFYGRLVDFMTSGPLIAAVLKHPDAIHALRELVGATDPAQAAEGTIRHKFGETVTLNAVHASDAPENARREAALLFPGLHQDDLE